MRRRSLPVVAGVVCAALCCFPAQGFAKRGLPDYVVEASCGDNASDAGRVLIAFATNYGTTYRVAEKVAEVLCDDGYRVDLRFAKDVTEADLSAYDAVILGSCIYIEQWHKDATAFLEKYQNILADKSVACFCVCGLLGMDMEDAAELADEHYLQPMYDAYPGIQFLSVTGFAGAVNYRILLPKDWWLLHLMFMPAGDWTDFEAVEAWAEDISGMLQ